jgi:hypothetical protein
MKNDFDGWPFLDDRFDFNQNTINLLMKYRKVGSSPLFSVYVSSNPTDPKYSIIRVYLTILENKIKRNFNKRKNKIG